MFRARQKGTESTDRENAAVQPRPALGRRPWFALLRRARNLRRFALAIRPQSVARYGDDLTVAAGDGSWYAAPVWVAASFFERWRGAKIGRGSVLLRCRHVHGYGLGQGLNLVGIGGDGRVVELQTLHPGSFARMPDAEWILELSQDHPLPEIGQFVGLYARPRGRQTHSMCDPDRESQ